MAKAKSPLPGNRKLYRVQGWYLAESGKWMKTTSELLTEADATARGVEWDRTVTSTYGKIPPGKRAVVVVDAEAVKEFEAEKAERRVK